MADASNLKFTAVPLSKLQAPREGCEVLLNRWWITIGDDAIFYTPDRHTNVPQCNASRSIAESLGVKLYPGSQVVHVPVAFVPRGCECSRCLG